MGIKLKFLILVLLLPLAACAKRPPPPQIEYVLGTICAVNLYEDGNSQLYSRIFSRIREIDRTMTAFEGEFQEIDGGIFDPDSPEAEAYHATTGALVSGLVAINRQAGIEPVSVRADLLGVLEKALYYAELSGGAFDPTIGPLVKLWGIGTGSQRVPSGDEIAVALALVGWRDLAIDRDAGTAFLRREGMALDLGAIAKGYAADEALRIAREGGARRAVLDFGGNIAVLGWRDGKGAEPLPWRIGIQNPLGERGAYIGILPVHDASVVTSGVYERFFEAGGTHYHHILSTANGYPVDNGLLSVSIVMDNSVDADGLSTAVFALGFERGKALIDSIPGAGAIFIFSDHSVQITDSLAGIFRQADDDFAVQP
jgi:thiamine biosynthesis lipoprotein